MKPAWLFERPIAHRGLHDDKYPENSLGAFLAGRDKGYPLELDVHLTRDKELVVVHDENLKRVTGQEVLITACDRAKWRSLKLCGSEEGIPTFDELLEAVDGRVPLDIEVKSDPCYKPGLLEDRLIERLRRYKGDFVLKSFDPKIVRYLRIHAPEFFVGLLASAEHWSDTTFWEHFIMTRLGLTVPYSKAQFIAYDVRSLPLPAVTRYHKKGMPVLGWTVRDEETRNRMKGIVDNIVFENFIPAE